jgi:hypothetical protein
MSMIVPAVYDPTERDVLYGGNYAQYLVDLDNARATFNFCGGMMFQLSLSSRLKEHLSKVALESEDLGRRPVIHGASHQNMQSLASYSQTSHVDNTRYFHGREIRKVAGAAGGRGFVLQLSLSTLEGEESDKDPEGWTPEEVATYDGWGHDSGRTWRKVVDWEKEGVVGFREKYGAAAYGLNHRFYFHLDEHNRFWLSAEDGCEGFAEGLAVDVVGDAMIGTSL